MWTAAQITITIEEVYGDTVLVRIVLPVGVLEVIGRRISALGNSA